MKLEYSAKLALSNLAHSKLRTWLTITGIVIGVTAVVLIISIGNVLQASVQSQLGGLGADVVSVSPGFSRAQSEFGGFRGGGPGGGGFGGGREGSSQANLTTKDLQAVLLDPSIKAATGSLSGRATIAFGAENSTAQVKGIDPRAWNEFYSSTDTISTGRELTSSDTNAVVLGSRLASQRFKRPVTTSSVVEIEGKIFRVVGVLAEGGSFGGDDNSILMPISQARIVLGSGSEQLSSISAKVSNAGQLDSITAELDQRLQYSRHVNNATKDFTITAAQSIRERISSVTSTISLFLGGIAAISLLVGAIGIANTMFMTVLERTKQIGVFKALGAKKSEVTRLFLIEAGVLGLAGGVIGVMLSLAISFLLSEAGIGLSLPAGPGSRGGGGVALITPELIGFALLFSTIIGMVAGYVPAKQAASLKPVEALKYE